MLERYKVLGAMLALKRFTVEDLVRFSEVNATTVRTVLKRDEKYLKDLGRRASGQPGGQFTQYELEPRYVRQLRAELEELFREVWAASRMQRRAHANVIPLSLLAVEDALIHRYPTATNRQDRQHILNLAGEGLNSGELQGESSALTSEFLGAHLRLARWLRQLAAAEFAVQEGKEPETHKLLQVWREVESSARNFDDLGDPDLASSVRERLNASPAATEQLLAALNEETYTDPVAYFEAEADPFEVNEASVEHEAHRFLTGRTD